MKKLLTSILAIGLVMPAMAENITNASSCNTGVLGQSDNNSTANVEATWTANTYSENPGYYLLFSNGTISQNQTCPAGSYCVGFTNQAFNDASMGIQSCPTGYTNSAAGTTTQDNCYATGTATCSTRNPYSGVNSDKVTNITYGNSNAGSASCKTYYGDQTTCVLDTANACEITDLTCATGYRKENTLIPNSSPISSNQLDTPGTSHYAKGYRNNADYCYGTGISSGNCTSEPVASMETNDWSVEFSYGTVKGIASCNSTAPSNLQEIMDAWGEDEPTEAMFAASAQPGGTFNSSSTGQYCWCQTESFTPTGGSTVGAYSSWVFYDGYGSASDCAGNCANDCADRVQYGRGFRGALFGSLGTYRLQCVANTINIDWDPQNGEAHTTNQCTYDGAITLPAEPSKTGYTFGGWRLKTN